MHNAYPQHKLCSLLATCRRGAERSCAVWYAESRRVGRTLRNYSVRGARARTQSAGTAACAYVRAPKIGCVRVAGGFAVSHTNALTLLTLLTYVGGSSVSNRNSCLFVFEFFARRLI